LSGRAACACSRPRERHAWVINVTAKTAFWAVSACTFTHLLRGKANSAISLWHCRCGRLVVYCIAHEGGDSCLYLSEGSLEFPRVRRLSRCWNTSMASRGVVVGSVVLNCVLLAKFSYLPKFPKQNEPPTSRLVHTHRRPQINCE